MQEPKRAFEFRAYHQPTGELFFVSQLTEYDVYRYGETEPIPLDECVLMQFTGLYDSKGQKVFEGDVVYSYYPSHDREPSVEYWRVIAYREGCFCDIESIDQEASICDLQPTNCEQDAVVGCYYLRPDLLALNTETGEVPETF